jgi:hypothetical protein
MLEAGDTILHNVEHGACGRHSAKKFEFGLQNFKNEEV